MTSSLHVKKILRHLVDLGADPSLCAPEDEARVHQLLNMSSEDCEHLCALQRVLAEPPYGSPSTTSYVTRISELKKLLQEGVDPAVCGKRDRRTIQKYLEMTDDDIAKLDIDRVRQLERLKAHSLEAERVYGSWLSHKTFAFKRAANRHLRHMIPR